MEDVLKPCTIDKIECRGIVRIEVDLIDISTTEDRLNGFTRSVPGGKSFYGTIEIDESIKLNHLNAHSYTGTFVYGDRETVGSGTVFLGPPVIMDGIASYTVYGTGAPDLEDNIVGD